MSVKISAPKDVAKLKDILVDVFSPAVNYTWYDLDLSPWVGANAVLCFFQIKIGSIGDDFWMKPKGYGGAAGGDHTLNGVCANLQGGTDYVYLACFTNNDGMVEVAGYGMTRTYIITLVGAIR